MVAESLDVGAELSHLTLIRLRRVPATTAVNGQAHIWTMLDISCAEQDVEQLVAQLEAALLDGPWYSDLSGPDIRYVIFKGRTFRFAPSDDAGDDAARAYGRKLGIPDAQLDWSR